MGLIVTALGITAGYFWKRPASLDLNREYRIGSDNAYPYHSVDASGTASGFAVEMLNEAARRRGVKLRWVLARGRAGAALRTGEVDLWPALSPESKRLDPALHLSEPWIHNDFAFVAIRDEFRAAGGASKVRSVAFRDQRNARRLATERFPGAMLIPTGDRGDAVSRVCSGEADGAVVELRSAYSFMANPPPSCHGRPPCFVGLTFEGEELGIAARAEAAAVADALRAEIDQMSADGTSERLLLPWSYFQSNEVQTMFVEKQLNRSLFWMRLAFAATGTLLFLVATQCFLMRKFWLARDRANAESWAKTRFMRKMSHELRTPLNGIVAGAELLKYTPLQEEQKEYIGIIHDSGATMLRLVQDLLDLSRATSGTLEIQGQPFLISDWLSRTLAPYCSQAAAKGIQLHTDLSKNLYSGAVTGDPIRIGQVVGNLVSNAIKFTARGSVRVKVATQEARGRIWLEISVTDTGPGIQPERLPGIFEEAVLRDRIDTSGGGLGLGLSISSELVRQMGGEIEAQSEFGHWSTFRFRLPLVAAEQAKSVGAA